MEDSAEDLENFDSLSLVSAGAGFASDLDLDSSDSEVDAMVLSKAEAEAKSAIWHKWNAAHVEVTYSRISIHVAVLELTVVFP